MRSCGLSRRRRAFGISPSMTGLSGLSGSIGRSSLLDHLISYWNLDEPTGNALDAHGSNPGVETGGTIATATGKIVECRDFELADAAYFVAADNAGLSAVLASWSVQAWVNLESKPAGLMTIAGKHDGASTDGSEWLLYWNNANDRFGLTVYGNSTSGNVQATSVAAPDLATWYSVHAGYDAVNSVIWISVNNQTRVTAAWTVGVHDTAAGFTIGATSGANLFFDGLIDEVGFWKRFLSLSDTTRLYGAGSGLAYGGF